VSDLVLVGAFANDPEAQVAAAALRNAGLHPVVLGHDPLAQLLDPGRGARLLVPEAERAAARDLLGIAVEDGPHRVDGPAWRSVAGFVWLLAFLVAAWFAPRLLPLVLIGATASWILLRRARRGAVEP
jgi:hypothetical protein